MIISARIHGTGLAIEIITQPTAVADVTPLSPQESAAFNVFALKCSRLVGQTAEIAFHFLLIILHCLGNFLDVCC